MKTLRRGKRKRVEVGGLIISDRAKQYIRQVLDTNRLSYGPFSRKFEREFAREHDVKYACFMNSGTDALRIALAALKNRYRWKDGDEVLVPAVTFVATANVVIQHHLAPVFVDVDPLTYNIDPAKIEERITQRTRAIIPVHLMGLPCEMKSIWQISRKYHLKILEDSCETMFGTYQGKKVGSLGDIGTFSTYVAHFLVTGVGGLATTNHAKLAVDMRSLMNHGRDPHYLSIDDHEADTEKELYRVVKARFRFILPGYSSRCTELEAALGLAQLEEKATLIGSRRRIAEKYTRELRDLDEHIQLPTEPKGYTHMYMLYPIVLRKESKWGLVNFLEKNRIGTRELMPLLRAPLYQKLFGNFEGQYPVAKWINRSGFYIGCHPHITDKEQDFVIHKIHEYFKRR